MKFLLVGLIFNSPGLPSMSPIAGPFSSIDSCEAAIVKRAARNDTLTRNYANQLVLNFQGRGEQFTACVGYNPEW